MRTIYAAFALLVMPFSLGATGDRYVCNEVAPIDGAISLHCRPYDPILDGTDIEILATVARQYSFDDADSIQISASSSELNYTEIELAVSYTCTDGLDDTDIVRFYYGVSAGTTETRSVREPCPESTIEKFSIILRSATITGNDIRCAGCGDYKIQ